MIQLNYPYQFDIGTIIRAENNGVDRWNGLFVVIGGIRNIMSMDTGHTVPACDANRWVSCKKVTGIRVKKLKPKTHEYLRLIDNTYNSPLVDDPILPRERIIDELLEDALRFRIFGR